ncbi:uncharacterized protein L203_103772 [Cryptococcus depauperatus CBS 7841]|uniref:Transcription initiation factor IIF subunit beta n=1 Tax=Cryptococcus depauperatus CBS 7841 TaxID=1295531 RepID=A0A1E3IG99_9TREE|nr:transcription initiation factor TFIIF subunit beta [Cryptococcus depauperatus CBS 7841]
MSSPVTSGLSAPSSSFPLPQEEEEHLAISERKDTSSVWAIKVPNFLLKRWEAVEDSGVELGRLVIDNSTTPPHITLKLSHPDDSAEGSRAKKAKYDTQDIPDEFSVHIPEERSRNTFLFSEVKKLYDKGNESGQAGSVPRDAWGKRRRDKANPKLLARVDHEGHVQPMRNQKYLALLKERMNEAEQSKRPVIRMEDTGLSQAEQNQLASGFRIANSTFGRNMIISSKQTGERFARLERNELTDRIFQCFRDHPYWSLAALKQTLEQPDAWLREVMRDVAEQVKEGKYIGYWQLKKEWREDAWKGPEGQEVKGEVQRDVKNEIKEEKDVKTEIDDNEEEDDDLEEVM